MEIVGLSAERYGKIWKDDFAYFAKLQTTAKVDLCHRVCNQKASNKASLLHSMYKRFAKILRGCEPKACLFMFLQLAEALTTQSVALQDSPFHCVLSRFEKICLAVSWHKLCSTTIM